MVKLMSKCCTRCKSDKSLFDFSDHPGLLDGKQSQCKDCFAERARLKRVGKPCISCGNPKEQGVSRGARLCLSCSATCFECKINPRRKQHRLCKECQAKRDKQNNSLPKNQHKNRISRIATIYKVTKDVAEKLASETNCFVCEKEFSDPRDRHIDHRHKTDKVRGVLCFNCNASLGHVNDNQTRLAKLIEYLAKHQNGASDIRKAIHYLELLLELQYQDKTSRT